ncbi:MAG: nitrogenase stabilizing/protective protein NifW [Burkholderiales bacterium]|nr:nitrogenase stabilizing/protective protein NifW [Burkholderiales bacterium]
MHDIDGEMRRLSTAEEFLEYFGVNYLQSVVNVNRLHILKRFGQYIARHKFREGGSDETRSEYRALLERAYQDFVESDAVSEKVFKVFNDASGIRTVSVDTLRAALAERNSGI